MVKNMDKFAGKLDVATINGKLAEERGVLIISMIKEANTDAKILVMQIMMQLITLGKTQLTI